MNLTQSIGKTIALWTLSILLTWSFASRCPGQSETGSVSTSKEVAPSWVLLSEIHVKPDMRQEWYDLQKNEVNPAFKKAGVSERAVWETVVGDLGTYFSVVSLENFAQLDGPGAIRRALEPEKRILLLQKLAKCINSRKRSTIRLRPDLSIRPSRHEPPKMAIVIDIKVVPGKQSAFEHLLRTELLPALKKAGIREFMATQTTFGGDPNRWTFLSMIPRFAEIDKGPPLVRALGREGAARLDEKFAGLTASANYSIARYNTELSFRK